MIATEGKAVYLIIKIADDGEFWSMSVTWYHNEEPIEEDYAHKIMADGNLVLCSVNWIIQDIYINEMNKFKCQQYWPDSGRKHCLDHSISSLRTSRSLQTMPLEFSQSQ